MAPKPSDLQEKVLAASQHLQEALVSAAEAIKTIADIIPSLAEGVSFSLPQTTTSSTLLFNRRVAALKDESTNATPSSNKRKRNQKDPDAPDKPLSAYHLYAKEKREQVKNALGADASGSDVVHEINRLWKELRDDLKKPFVEAAEKLKDTYKQTFADYEQKRAAEPSDNPSNDSPKGVAESARAKSAPFKAGAGFTAVKASPLVINADDASESDDDSQDEAAVAAGLGGSHPPSSVSPAKKQKKDTPKQRDSGSAKREKKEKAKEKSKDKDKEKRKRRKSDKAES